MMENKKQKQKDQLHKYPKGMRIAVLLFLAALIIAADLWYLAGPDRAFSENENRVLQEAPKADLASVISGDYMTRAENYVEDQFLWRDAWIRGKLFLDKLSGKKESNDVILGRNGYLMEKPVPPLEDSFYRNLDAISAFAGRHEFPVVLTLVPPAAWVMDQVLPDHIPLTDVHEIMEQVRERLITSDVMLADVTDALKVHKAEPIYYKSDHHWTSLGCRYAFEAMTEKLGIVDAVQKYAIMDAAYDFSGTMAAASGEFQTKDTIQIYVPLVGARADGSESPGLPAGDEAGDAGSQMEQALSTNLKYVAQYFDTGRRSATIYDSQALSGKDKYQVFLGGNHPQIVIHTNADNGRNLLLLKDSYANAFVQFLLPYYSSITIVDPRYYSDDLEQLIREQEITEALILYSENNFMADRSLYGVLE